jgi:DNA modification methylase
MEYKRIIDDRWSFKDADTKEYTHCYHTYPAMMIPQVARSLISEYHPEGKLEMLFDPYMGSGTSLVEASLAGINSIGTDLNPLARLMSKVKTTHYDTDDIIRQYRDLQSYLVFYSESDVKNRNFDRLSNYSFWYSEESLLKLSFLQQLIEEHADSDFFRLVLSEVVREVSFTRNGEFKRYRMNAKSLSKFHPDAFNLFEKKVERNIAGLIDFNDNANNDINVRICDFNSTTGIPKQLISDGSIDMIVTSPPYGDSRTTVAYGQFSRWANEWFGFEDAKNLDSQLMGGNKVNEELFTTESIRKELDLIRKKDEKRYFEVISFLNDYWLSMSHVSEAVRLGGMVCYVVGNRNVKGVQIPLDYFTAEMFEKCGFKHVTTIVREIPNKRMPSKTSPTNKPGEKVNTMSNEFIVILEKIA